ncbi:MAG TPA: hypothetical protein VHE54_01920 [Puia sp.]|nr:hypothetical protein [Puia sp.]
MLKLILSMTIILPALAGRPQSIADLAEQLVLDGEKLSSLKATLQDMYQGYQTLQQGYTRIRDIARDNFTLHQAFLDAMWLLSPAVRGDPRLEAIINTEYRVVQEYKAGMARVAGSAIFSPAELSYLSGVFSNILQQSTQAIEELTMITTDNELRMSDAQRLQAMDRIDAEVKDELGLLERLDNEVAIETVRRNKEANDIHTLKAFYGISN